MKTITLNFETEELCDNFIGWFCDGGGEDNFYSTIEYTDRTPFITHTTFENSKVKSINFKECNKE